MRSNSVKRGFTLMEVMFAAGIMLIAIGGLLGAYVLCFNLAETAKNLSLANNAIRQELEEIRHQKIVTVNHYDNTTFNVPGFTAKNGAGVTYVQTTTLNVPGDSAQNAKGVIYVDAIPNTTDLVRVTISVSWRQKGGRIIGTDNGSGGGMALNGIRDGAEQVDANGVLTSPAMISEVMTNR